MAWTSPKTWSVGDVLTAADMNAYVRDNTKWVGVDAPRCRAYRSTTFQHNSTGNWLSPTLDAERADTGTSGMHSTSSNTERLTVPTGGDGWYVLSAHCKWDTNTSGARIISIELNGTANSGTLLCQHEGSGTATGLRQSIATVYRLAAADYVVMTLFQNSGGTRDVNSESAVSLELAAAWVGF